MENKRLSRDEFEENLKDRNLESTARQIMFDLEMSGDGASAHRVFQAKFSMWRMLDLKKKGRINASTFGEYQTKENPNLRYSEMMNSLYRAFEKGAFNI